MKKTKVQTKHKSKSPIPPQAKAADSNLAGVSDMPPERPQTEGEKAGKDKPDKPRRNGTMKEDQLAQARSRLFDRLNEREFEPEDFQTEVAIDSLESSVGYSSLVRQFHQSYMERVAYYRSQSGGSLPAEEARKAAFHEVKNVDEAKQIFNRVMSYSMEHVSFDDLHSLYSAAPRVAERLWERIKQEGRKEFESGHSAANALLPASYMRDAWTVARYLGIRESFIDEWKPTGGIEVSLIDMLAQAFFQYQYWMEETVKRSQTRERRLHPDYDEWQRLRGNDPRERGWDNGYWQRTYVTEQQAIEHAVQMTDRWNRIYMRTLRQLRDLRRYSPVTINNPSQVNIAADGGQQVNVSNRDDKRLE
jgi:hypothetical protein